MIALGHTNSEIAEQLYLSVRTVETHRSHIQQKLRLSTRAELVGYALERVWSAPTESGAIELLRALLSAVVLFPDQPVDGDASWE